MDELKILHQKKLSDSITAFAVESPFPRPKRSKFGIDPGTTNLGIATVHPVPNAAIMLYQITMKREDRAIDRMLMVRKKLTQCIQWFGEDPLAIIEGAAYSRSHRQSELAEIRATIALWFHGMGVDVEIVPPNSIRKQVFKHGRTKNIWSNLQDDIAAALACAYYSVNKDSTSSTEVSLRGK